jgi:hypothetical protein
MRRGIRRASESGEATPVPVTHQIDSGLIRTKCTGTVTFEEVMAHFDALETDPALPDGADVLLDLGEMVSLPESEQLRSVAERVRRLLGRVRWGACAIVARQDALFGMSRMFEIFSQNSFTATRVFRERREAEAWLDATRERAP